MIQAVVLFKELRKDVKNCQLGFGGVEKVDNLEDYCLGIDLSNLHTKSLDKVDKPMVNNARVLIAQYGKTSQVLETCEVYSIVNHYNKITPSFPPV